MVTVIVGPSDSATTFHVHRGLLEHFSTFFKAALEGEWKLGTTRIIKPPDDKDEVFALFFHWLCQGTLYTATQDQVMVPFSY